MAAGKEKVRGMKKFFALLMTVTIAGMTASASVDPDIYKHSTHEYKFDGTYSVTTTHPVWVANKPNGEPILATCTVTYTYEKYIRICKNCSEPATKSVLISDTHSMTHN